MSQCIELKIRVAMEIDLPPKVNLIAARILMGHLVLVRCQNEANIVALAPLDFDTMDSTRSPVFDVVSESLVIP